jgi:hypothetical protein
MTIDQIHALGPTRDVDCIGFARERLGYASRADLTLALLTRASPHGETFGCPDRLCSKSQTLRREAAEF